MKFKTFKAIHNSSKSKDTIRLGQRFILACGFSKPWPELFYEEDEVIAELLIKEYLSRYQHYDTNGELIVPVKEIF